MCKCINFHSAVQTYAEGAEISCANVLKELANMY